MLNVHVIYLQAIENHKNYLFHDRYFIIIALRISLVPGLLFSDQSPHHDLWAFVSLLNWPLVLLKAGLSSSQNHRAEEVMRPISQNAGNLDGFVSQWKWESHAWDFRRGSYGSWSCLTFNWPIASYYQLQQSQCCGPLRPLWLSHHHGHPLQTRVGVSDTYCCISVQRVTQSCCKPLGRCHVQMSCHTDYYYWPNSITKILSGLPIHRNCRHKVSHNCSQLHYKPTVDIHLHAFINYKAIPK